MFFINELHVMAGRKSNITEFQANTLGIR